jgi:methylmalonyl-CoA mutase N-terminal domain/subunit
MHPPDFAALADQQRARVAGARARRDQQAAAGAVAHVETAARGTGRLMPQIVEAVRARSTLGEISDALRRAWGTYQP